MRLALDASSGEWVTMTIVAPSPMGFTRLTITDTSPAGVVGLMGLDDAGPEQGCSFPIARVFSFGFLSSMRARDELEWKNVVRSRRRAALARHDWRTFCPK